jgi:hypothetical protein
LIKESGSRGITGELNNKNEQNLLIKGPRMLVDKVEKQMFNSGRRTINGFVEH